MTLKKKILVGMSGGVDSSVTCALLLKNNYDVEGVSLNYGKFCEESDEKDAIEVAKQLGIKHHIVKCEDIYEEKVVKYFVNSYSDGETPNPCANCNKYIKFPKLLEMRERLDCDFLATGHYARITIHNGEYWIEKGIDITKDQSYFIGQIKYDYLQYLKFPLGEMTKKEVREFAKSINLFVADKSESQDMCLAKGKDYREILRNYINPQRGDIINIADGKKIGEHNGITDYTQGQRKGLNIGGADKPLFVVKIDPRKNIVYVGYEEDLFQKKILIDSLNLFDLSMKFNLPHEVDIKLRSTTKTDRATIILNENKTADIILTNPSRNVSKGQLCAIYDNNRLLCSGFIK
jgi:tRNA-specific 2-thiouridylase